MKASFQLSLVAILAVISFQFSSTANAFSAEECQAKYSFTVSRVATINANTQQAFATGSRYRFAIQKLNDQKISVLKNQYQNDCSQYPGPL